MTHREIIARAQRCGQCGGPHLFDVSVPSEQWNKFASPDEMLCLICIDERAAAKGVSFECEFYWNGNAGSSRLYADSWGDRQAALRDAYERGKAEALADIEKRGLCIVPVEPTTEMWNQAENASIISEADYQVSAPKAMEDARNFPTFRVWQAIVMYRAMISAAPK